MANSHIIETEDDIHVWAIVGEALGSAIWTSTHVTSSGGGGHVGPYGGHVSAPTVSSSTTTHKRFFIRTANGKESEIELSDSSFGVRDGHGVSAIYAQHRDADSGWLVYLYNHDTGQRVERKTSLKKLRGRHKKRWIILSIPIAILSFPIGLIAPATWFWFYRQKRAHFAAIDGAIFARARALSDREAPAVEHHMPQ